VSGRFPTDADSGLLVRVRLFRSIDSKSTSGHAFGSLGKWKKTQGSFPCPLDAETVSSSCGRGSPDID
jgi:hypothetical protein